MVGFAVLVAASDRDQRSAELAPQGIAAAALTPVLDRPIVTHAVADLVGLGVSRIVVLVDEASERPVAAALASEPLDGASVTLRRRNPGHGLLRTIAAARQADSDGPFLLRFADCIGRTRLAEQLGAPPAGDYDAVALTGRFGERPAVMPSETARIPPVSEFHVGVFLLGAGFPSALPTCGGSSWMGSALAWMEQRGGRIDRRFVDGWWRHRDRAGGTLAANRFALAELEGDVAVGSLVDSDVDHAVCCHPSARIESSVIRGPAWIGPDARIYDSFVGPFTSIGARVSIDGVEIENSVVLEGSTIANVVGRLDSSVIGPHATVTKDFRLPRGTRLEVGSGASVSLQ